MGMGGQRHDLATSHPLPRPGMTHSPLYSRLWGSKGRAGRVRKFSPTTGLDLRTFQPIATYCFLLTNGFKSDDHVLRERKWHSHGLLPHRRLPHIMVKMISELLSVLARRMERFDVCTFDLKRRTTWNLKNSFKLNSEEVWHLWWN